MKLKSQGGKGQMEEINSALTEMMENISNKKNIHIAEKSGEDPRARMGPSLISIRWR